MVAVSDLEIALVVLKPGLYNDRENQAFKMEPGNAFVTTKPYGLSLVRDGWCKPYQTPDDTILATDEAAAKEAQELGVSASQIMKMAEALETIGLPVKVIRAIQIMGVESLPSLELWVTERSDEFLAAIKGLGPSGLDKIRTLFE